MPNLTNQICKILELDNINIIDGSIYELYLNDEYNCNQLKQYAINNFSPYKSDYIGIVSDVEINNWYDYYIDSIFYSDVLNSYLYTEHKVIYNWFLDYIENNEKVRIDKDVIKAIMAIKEIFITIRGCVI